MSLASRASRGAAALALALAVALSVAAQGARAENFIRIVNGEFVDGCEQFLVAGWNQWEVIEAAAGAPELIGASLPPGESGPRMLQDMLDLAVEHGFNLMRAWAHSVSPQFALQPSPGEYNEGMFRGLDFALDEARKRGIRVLLSFTDNWPPSGGIDEYVSWSSTAESHTDFFTDAQTKQMYKDHVQQLITRVNSVNGRTYRDDPTIMGWNLINEPRCQGCPEAVQAWIEEMAPYVKGLDPNHLLTVGEEGFYSTSGKTWANPQGAGRWPEEEGQDFINNHSPEAIDFMSFHSWVDNWEDVTEEFQRRWIQEHTADAVQLGKPVILEEFGKIVQPEGPFEPDRVKFFQIVYDEVLKQMDGGKGALKGANFWQWYDEGQVAPVEEGGGAGLYGIFASDETFGLIKAFTDTVNGMGGNTVEGCTKDRSSSVKSKVKECKKKRVNGLEGTGYEGPKCKIDINECVRGTAGCHANAGCINTDGGFTCQCHPGYEGDGQSVCEETASLAEIQAQYTTAGPGILACEEGEDVQYPIGAPGFVYDPTGSVDLNEFTKGQFGSREDTTILDCQLACEMAEGCDSFSFNPTLKQCFLKSCPSQDTCEGEETICTSEATGEQFSCGRWQTYFHSERLGTACLASNGP
ncbi:unnamed protein product [Ostreobium quekettii]|uniref:mannan endo-1,4-beta-mannosidase n=1 Tax=Ostreobium quekettii TaxID=121088 RepID=A0A8S1J407_9CHLO|nr:unnamed protein product [Ostreobium quekettii]|eukprot:evm.model.scf_238EXC.4 EVM.evm.TU.scf_238EXC.4   scf_238EXC:33203-40439(+)